MPHPYYNEDNCTVCLILRDIEIAKSRKDSDVDKDARKWEEVLYTEHGITRKQVQKVIVFFVNHYSAIIVINNTFKLTCFIFYGIEL